MEINGLFMQFCTDLQLSNYVTQNEDQQRRRLLKWSNAMRKLRLTGDIVSSLKLPILEPGGLQSLMHAQPDPQNRPAIPMPVKKFLAEAGPYSPPLTPSLHS